MRPFDEIAGLISSELFGRALEATGHSVVITDPHAADNPLVYVNPAFERLTGFSADEVIGRNCRFLQGPETDPSAIAQLRRAIAAREDATVLMLNHRADGSVFWNEVAISPVFGPDGEIQNFVGVQNDVTARVVAELGLEAALISETEARTTLESVLAAAPLGLAFFDCQLRITQVNAALAQLTGLLPDQHVGSSAGEVFDALGADIGAHLEAVRDEHRSVLDVELEIAHSHLDESNRTWTASFYPVLDGANNLVRIGAIFNDVTELRRAERERAVLLERERIARHDAERVGEQVAMLARAMEALADTIHLDRSLTRFLTGLVPAFADWCAIDIRCDDGMRRVDSRALDPALLESVERAEHERRARGSGASLVEEVFVSGHPVLLPDVVGGTSVPASVEGVVERPSGGLASMMVIPVRSRGRTIGVLSLGRADDDRAFTDDDLGLGFDLASRAGLAIDNAELYQQEHRVAETLQRALLPPAVPEVNGLEICVRYQPGADGVEVGGDWFDVVGLADGSVALSVGDVVGHDLSAAVRMSQLRTVLRAATSPELAGKRSPAASVDRLDDFAQEYGIGFVATLLHGVLEPSTGLFTYVRAGHLPLVLVDAEGRAQIVEDQVSAPLGLGQVEREDNTVVLAPGCALVLYTDGLIERRGENIDDGLERLRSGLVGSSGPIEGWCDEMLETLAPAATTTDDVAVLVARRIPS